MPTPPPSRAHGRPRLGRPNRGTTWQRTTGRRRARAAGRGSAGTPRRPAASRSAGRAPAAAVPWCESWGSWLVSSSDGSRVLGQRLGGELRLAGAALLVYVGQ